jgi:hypothetical protein
VASLRIWSCSNNFLIPERSAGSNGMTRHRVLPFAGDAGHVGAAKEELHGSMNDLRLGRQRERRPNHGLPPVLGNQSIDLPSEWFGRLLTLSLGQAGHAAKVDLITPGP